MAGFSLYRHLLWFPFYRFVKPALAPACLEPPERSSLSPTWERFDFIAQHIWTAFPHLNKPRPSFSTFVRIRNKLFHMGNSWIFHTGHFTCSSKYFTACLLNVCVIGEKSVFHKQDAGALSWTDCLWFFSPLLEKEGVIRWQDWLHSSSRILLVCHQEWFILLTCCHEKQLKFISSSPFIWMGIINK